MSQTGQYMSAQPKQLQRATNPETAPLIKTTDSFWCGQEHWQKIIRNENHQYFNCAVRNFFHNFQRLLMNSSFFLKTNSYVTTTTHRGSQLIGRNFCEVRVKVGSPFLKAYCARQVVKDQCSTLLISISAKENDLRLAREEEENRLRRPTTCNASTGPLIGRERK